MNVDYVRVWAGDKTWARRHGQHRCKQKKQKLPNRKFIIDAFHLLYHRSPTEAEIQERLDRHEQA